MDENEYRAADAATQKRIREEIRQQGKAAYGQVQDGSGNPYEGVSDLFADMFVDGWLAASAAEQAREAFEMQRDVEESEARWAALWAEREVGMTDEDIEEADWLDSSYRDRGNY